VPDVFPNTHELPTPWANNLKGKDMSKLLTALLASAVLGISGTALATDASTAVKHPVETTKSKMSADKVEDRAEDKAEAQYKAAKKEADAKYTVAKENCKDKKGADEHACVKQAKADRDHAIAEAKATRDKEKADAKANKKAHA